MDDGFSEIYARYGGMVLRRCRKLLNNESRAVEAMQDTFVRFLKIRDRSAHTGLSSLLYQMATQVSLNLMRTDRRHPEDAVVPEILRNIADQAHAESRLVARNFLAKLLTRQPQTTAWMAVAFYHDGMTLEELANESGLSVSGVRKRLRKFGAEVREMKEE